MKDIPITILLEQYENMLSICLDAFERVTMIATTQKNIAVGEVLIEANEKLQDCRKEFTEIIKDFKDDNK